MDIKLLRERNGLTQKELSERLGVSRSALAMWESENRCPPTRQLPALAEALNCTIDELFSDKEAG